MTATTLQGHNILILLRQQYESGGLTMITYFRWSLISQGSIAISGSNVTGADGLYRGIAKIGRMSMSLPNPGNGSIVYPSLEFTLARDDTEQEGLNPDIVALIRGKYRYFWNSQLYVYRLADGPMTTTTEVLDMSETGVNVTNISVFTTSCYIAIDSECMKITHINGNTLTVMRGQRGTMAATHTIGATVTLWGRATIPATTNLIFVGQIGRGDVTITRERVSINCSSRQYFERTVNQRPQFDGSEEAASHVASDWQGKTKPLLFGNWIDVSSYYWVPVPVISTINNGRTLECQLAAPGAWGFYLTIYEIEWRNGQDSHKGGYSSKSFYTTAGQSEEGLFKIIGSSVDVWATALNAVQLLPNGLPPNVVDADLYEWRDGDKIRVKSCRGIIGYRAGLSNAVVTHPVDVIYTILRDPVIGLGIMPSIIGVGSLIDVGSFENIRDVILTGYDFQVRAWIGDDTKPMDLIAQLCSEFGLALVVLGGLYTLIWLSRNISGLTVSDAEIRPENIVGWSESLDANRDGAAEFRMEYALKPEGGTTRVIETAGADDAIEILKITSKWIYDDNTAATVQGIQRYLRSGAIRTVDMTLDFNFFDLRIGDTVEIVGHDDLDDLYRVHSTDHDLEEGADVKVQLVTLASRGVLAPWAGAVGSDVPAHFGGGTVPMNFAAATAKQKIGLGFWAATGASENPDGGELKRWG